MIFKVFKFFHNFFYSRTKINVILNEFKKINKNTVLLIGNSNNVFKEQKGFIIDKFEYVIRFNAAKTQGFENYVGEKTSMAVINQEIFEQKYINEKIDKDYVAKLSNKDIFVILENDIDQNYNFESLKKKNNLIFFHNKFNHYLRYCLVSRFNYIRKFYHYLYGKKLSSGMVLISLLTMSDCKISIFGFDLKKNKKKYSHYYEENHTNYNTVHDWAFENALLKSFIKNKKVNVV